MRGNSEVCNIRFNQKALILLCLSIAVAAGLASTLSLGSATLENKTLMQPQGTQGTSNTTTNASNIVLVHGGWADGSGWSKQIPILEKAGHKVIAVQLPLHSLSDDVETVQRAISRLVDP
jgi:pimeloyl-ACP methyl ester carboxylesterase